MKFSLIDFPDKMSYWTSRALSFIPEPDLTWKIFAIAWVVLLTFVAFKKSIYLKHRNLYIFLLIIGLIGFRTPNLILHVLSFDESDWITCAATLIKRPLFWGDVDATTSGPLNIYPLTIINLLGFGLNYYNLRLFGLLVCIVPTGLLFLAIIKNRYPKGHYFLYSLPVFFLLSFLNDIDIVAFNSTHIPMVIITVCLFLLFRKWDESKQKYIFYLLLLILGAIPYMKLQVVPMGAVLGLWGYYKAYFEWKLSIKVLLLGFLFVLIPSLLTGLYLLYFDIVEDFWQFYIVNNLLYTKYGVAGSQKTWLYKIQVPLYLIKGSGSLRYFIWSLFFVGLISFSVNLYHIRTLTRRSIGEIIWTSLLLLSTYYCISVPGNLIHYYLILLIVPLAIWAIYNIIVATDQLTENIRKGAMISFAFLLILFPSLMTISLGSLGMQYVEKGFRGHTISAVAKVIVQYSEPNDPIVVFGYRQDIYVETNTLLGIRASSSFRLIKPFNRAQQEYYEQSYVNDILRNDPKVFVDATGNSDSAINLNAKDHRFENYPLLNEIVQKRFIYKGTYDGMRVFVKK